MNEILKAKIQSCMDVYAGNVLKVIHDIISSKKYTQEECLSLIEHLMNDCYNKALQFQAEVIINEQ